MSFVSKQSLQDSCVFIAQKCGLTNREAEILYLLAQNERSANIQKILGITRNTYKTHVRHIYEKTGVSSRIELLNLVQHA